MVHDRPNKYLSFSSLMRVGRSCRFADHYVCTLPSHPPTQSRVQFLYFLVIVGRRYAHDLECKYLISYAGASAERTILGPVHTFSYSFESWAQIEPSAARALLLSLIIS